MHYGRFTVFSGSMFSIFMHSLVDYYFERQVDAPDRRQMPTGRHLSG